MLLTLAVRNVLRNLRRLAPMMASITLVFVLLLLGNAVLNRTIEALYGVYAKTVAGDITVSAEAESNFTIFGSDQLLVGQYLDPPTIVGFEALQEEVGSWEQVRAAAGLVSAVAQLEIGGKKTEATVFGVDFSRYPALVPGLEPVAGSFPQEGQTGIMLQERMSSEAIGKKALLASGGGRNFSLREAPVTGTFRYSVRDKALERIVLVNADIARSLNGYLYGAEEAEPLSEEDRGALDSDFSSLFSEGDGQPSEAEEAGSPAGDELDPNALFSSSGDGSGAKGPDGPGTEARAKEEEKEEGVKEGAWNFLLVSLNDRSKVDEVIGRIKDAGYTEEAGYRVRSWQESVGGNAHLAWYLQLLFNIGLLFLSFGAAVIATNALLLSVLERTEEIGTLRAMGAGKAKVAALISLETLIVVFASAALGIGLGALAVGWLNEAGLELENRYIRLLFGGEPIRGVVAAGDVLAHLAAALLLTLLAVLYPIKRALSVRPVEAMAE